MRIYRQWRRNSPIGNNGNWRCVAVDVTIFCPKTLRARTGSVPSVGDGFREGHTFASGWIGSAPFQNLEKKSFLLVFPCLIEIICFASIVDRDHKVCIIRRCPYGSTWSLVSPDLHAKRIYRHADLSPMAEKFSHRK